MREVDSDWAWHAEHKDGVMQGKAHQKWMKPLQDDMVVAPRRTSEIRHPALREE